MTRVIRFRRIGSGQRATEDPPTGRCQKVNPGGATKMGTMKNGMRGAHVIVDGEELTVEDTVMAAVCDGRLSPDLLDHGFDTYWCVTEDGHHRLLRASELVTTR